MFSMHNFVFVTLLGMIGKEPEYKVRKYALGWFDRDVLTQEDLAVLEERFVEFATPSEEESEEVEE